ncbi:MAG: uracil-DNA glycosylase [Pirellulaceae bacterium]
MTDRATSNKNLNPDTVLAQSAALARHLQASGVEFMPIANAKHVAELESHFATAAKADEVKTPAARAESATPRTATTPAATTPAAKPIIADAVEVSYDGPPLSQDDRTARLNVLSQSVAACTRCDKLAVCRTNTVFGEGSVMPRVAFFGEGPGADEDRTGRPFVGKAGELLTKMIEACSFRREDVYILNTVKCRPPGNRNPDPSELANCREYFEQQLAVLRPEYIVCLGAISSQTLLGSKLSVGRLRGKFHRYFDSKVLVTYHPAYLLRNPDAKKAAWQDLQLMLRDAGIIPS